MYGQHLQNSPFIIPVGEDLLSSLGLCHLEGRVERASQVTPGAVLDISSNNNINPSSMKEMSEEPPRRPQISIQSNCSTTNSDQTLQSESSKSSTLKDESGISKDPVIQHPIIKDKEPFSEDSTVYVTLDGMKQEGKVLKKDNDSLYIVKMSEPERFMGFRPVEMTLERWTVGEVCIAKWNDDGVWYNAVIENSLPGGSYQVWFSDYGHAGFVTAENIVSSSKGIPDGELVDSCVDQGPEIVDSNVEPYDIMADKRNFQSDHLNYSDLVGIKLKTSSRIEVGAPVSSLALLESEILLCLTSNSPEVLLFDSLKGQRIGSLADLTNCSMSSPEAVLSIQTGGFIVTDVGGVHVFDSNCEYTDFMPIPESSRITSLTEGEDFDIITLNQSYKETFVLSTPLFGESKEKKNLNSLIFLASAIDKEHVAGQDGGLVAPLRSDCKFITKKKEKLYIAGRFILI